MTRREVLAPREDVWAFLAEPYHLADWWPGIVAVQPDRRGFAPGARWTVQYRATNILIGTRLKETLLVVREIDPFERWSWHLLATKDDVEIRVRAVGDHTIASLAVGGRTRRFEELALRRLYDLVQTASTL